MITSHFKFIGALLLVYINLINGFVLHAQKAGRELAPVLRTDLIIIVDSIIIPPPPPPSSQLVGFTPVNLFVLEDDLDVVVRGDMISQSPVEEVEEEDSEGDEEIISVATSLLEVSSTTNPTSSAESSSEASWESEELELDHLLLLPDPLLPPPPSSFKHNEIPEPQSHPTLEKFIFQQRTLFGNKLIQSSGFKKKTFKLGRKGNFPSSSSTSFEGKISIGSVGLSSDSSSEKETVTVTSEEEREEKEFEFLEARLGSGAKSINMRVSSSSSKTNTRRNFIQSFEILGWISFVYLVM